jgi:hypothetical protein
MSTTLVHVLHTLIDTRKCIYSNCFLPAMISAMFPKLSWYVSFCQGTPGVTLGTSSSSWNTRSASIYDLKEQSLCRPNLLNPDAPDNPSQRLIVRRSDRFTLLRKDAHAWQACASVYVPIINLAPPSPSLPVLKTLIECSYKSSRK